MSFQLIAQRIDSNSVVAIEAKAERGDANAQYDLAYCYRHGVGVKQDSTEADVWLLKAANQGNVLAETVLGLSYVYGRGFSTNLDEGKKWLSKAANAGWVKAQFFLGGLYEDAHDFPMAFLWYNRAANQGYVAAMGKLGDMYYNGNGVPQNYVLAYKWYNLGACQTTNRIDLDVAEPTVAERESLNTLIRHDAKMRDLLTDLMTREDISEAQRESSRFFVTKETISTRVNESSSNSPSPLVAFGTGFFITDNGYLISNYHVVAAGTKPRLVIGGGVVDAKVVRADVANDLALLKIDGHFAPLPVVSSGSVALGDTVATVGFPDPDLQGISPKLAKGEISALAGAGDDPRYFQVSLPLQPGNSGGALVDAKGNVVGVVSAKLDAAAALAASGALPENVNYGIKSSYLLSFLESVPGVASKLGKVNTEEEKFEDVVKTAQAAAVLVLVY